MPPGNKGRVYARDGKQGDGKCASCPQSNVNSDGDAAAVAGPRSDAKRVTNNNTSSSSANTAELLVAINATEFFSMAGAAWSGNALVFPNGTRDEEMARLTLGSALVLLLAVKLLWSLYSTIGLSRRREWTALLLSGALSQAIAACGAALIQRSNTLNNTAAAVMLAGGVNVIITMSLCLAPEFEEVSRALSVSRKSKNSKNNKDGESVMKSTQLVCGGLNIIYVVSCYALFGNSILTVSLAAPMVCARHAVLKIKHATCFCSNYRRSHQCSNEQIEMSLILLRCLRKHLYTYSVEENAKQLGTIIEGLQECTTLRSSRRSVEDKHALEDLGKIPKERRTALESQLIGDRASRTLIGAPLPRSFRIVRRKTIGLLPSQMRGLGNRIESDMHGLVSRSHSVYNPTEGDIHSFVPRPPSLKNCVRSDMDALPVVNDLSSMYVDSVGLRQRRLSTKGSSRLCNTISIRTAATDTAATDTAATNTAAAATAATDTAATAATDTAATDTAATNTAAAATDTAATDTAAADTAAADTAAADTAATDTAASAVAATVAEVIKTSNCSSEDMLQYDLATINAERERKARNRTTNKSLFPTGHEKREAKSNNKNIEEKLDSCKMQNNQNDISDSEEQQQPTMPTIASLSKFDLSTQQSAYFCTKMVDWEFGSGGLFARLEDSNMPAVFRSDPLTTTFTQAAVYFECVRALGIDIGDMIKYMQCIEESYISSSQVQYHNALHATDVLQSACALLSIKSVCDSILVSSEYLHELSIFALLFSAAVHDVAHPGRNQSFHMRTQSDLSILYSDRSVMEHHHLAVTFQHMRKRPFLHNVDPDDLGIFREKVITMVLATDNKLHKEGILELQELVASDRPMSRAHKDQDPHTGLSHVMSPRSYHGSPRNSGSVCGGERASSESEADLNTIMCSLLHMSDISNVAKDWEAYKQWIPLLFEEFFAQGDDERELGYEVMLLHDRDACLPCEMQCFFINVFVSDLVDLLDVWCPDIGRVTHHNLIKNKEHLERNKALKLPDMWTKEVP